MSIIRGQGIRLRPRFLLLIWKTYVGHTKSVEMYLGGKAKAEKVLSTGIHLSIGEKFSLDTIAAIPDDELIIETDESTLTIGEIATKVAEARNTTANAVMTLSAKNIARIFRLVNR